MLFSPSFDYPVQQTENWEKRKHIWKFFFTLSPFCFACFTVSPKSGEKMCLFMNKTNLREKLLYHESRVSKKMYILDNDVDLKWYKIFSNLFVHQPWKKYTCEGTTLQIYNMYQYIFQWSTHLRKANKFEFSYASSILYKLPLKGIIRKRHVFRDNFQIITAFGENKQFKLLLFGSVLNKFELQSINDTFYYIRTALLCKIIKI